MGIGLNSVHLLAGPLQALGELSGRRILTLGVQDCAFTYPELQRFLDKHGIAQVALGANEVELTNGFKWVDEAQRAKYAGFVHQRTLFRALGFRVQDIRSLDYSAFEGADIVHDLNAPVDPALHGGFDLVYDGGTLEHVFSTRDCLFNMSRLCKVGGIVVSVSPVDLINHGFINVNAALFRDFFHCNGYEEIDLKYIAMPANPVLARRYYRQYSPEELHHPVSPFYAMHLFSAFRKTREATLQIPNQGFYEALWRQTGVQNAGRPSPGWLRSCLIAAIDRSFALSQIVRGFRMLLRGKRVPL